jgi:hypothetical protein
MTPSTYPLLLSTEKGTPRNQLDNLTWNDFQKFLAYVPETEQPGALSDLKPISIDRMRESCISYQFSEEDAKTILGRYYSEEEIGMQVKSFKIS